MTQGLIEPSISLGNIIAALSIIVTLFVLHSQNRARFDRMETKVDLLWRWFVRSQVKGPRGTADDENGFGNGGHG